VARGRSRQEEVLKRLPPDVAKLVESGDAWLRRDSDGWSVCLRDLGCFGILKKASLSELTIRLLSTLAKGCYSLKELVRILGCDYHAIHTRVHYFERRGVVRRDVFCYTLNPSHPQYRALLRLLKVSTGERQQEEA